MGEGGRVGVVWGGGVAEMQEADSERASFCDQGDTPLGVSPREHEELHKTHEGTKKL